jgi:hypothetical protein
MSAFARSLSAVQALATATWGPGAKLRFECDLSLPIDPEQGITPTGANIWRAWLENAGPAVIVGVCNSGVGALDDLLKKLREHLNAGGDFFVTPEILARAVHGITCAKCGTFRSRQDTPDYCVCGHPRGLR